MDEIANRMLPALMNGQAIDEKDAYAWIDYQGPYCPKLIEYLKKNHDNYDVFIFITYLYYHTVYGLPAVSDRAIFIPTAHDEPWLHLSMFSKLFRLPRRFLYCTQEEQDMVHRMLHNEDVPGEAIGVGIDIPEKKVLEKQIWRFHSERIFCVQDLSVKKINLADWQVRRQ